MKHLRTPFFLLVALAIHTNLILSHTCVHDETQHDLQPINLPHTEKQGRMLVDYQSLRILFDYSNLNLADANLYDYIVNELIPPAKNYFGAALSIPKTTDKLLFPAGTTTVCKGAITVPSVYLTTGADADLLIFVTAQAEVGVDYVAYSSICLIDGDTFRPVGGRLHFNTNVIQQKNKEAQREADMVTTMHEITHILGFSSSVYSNYIDPTTKVKLTNHLTTVVKNGISTQVLNLTPLTSRLQTYFGCNTLQGAYLENQGATGSIGSHLERRIFFNEYMTASRLNDARISEFTLALLEGSGWYKANYDMAEPMTWGKGKGCTFVDGPCVDTTVTPKVGKFDEFCSPLMERGCSWTGREGSMCGDFLIETSNSIPAGVNWWANSTMMRDPYADNCPIYQAFSNTDCEDVDNIASAKIAGSASGYGSKCFMGTLSNTGTARPFGSYCFRATCESYGVGQKRINVQVGSALGVCVAEGDIGIAGVTGALSCPDPVKFCNVIENEGYCRRECMSRGTCVNKECQCVVGWGSMDCGKRVYTDCDRCRGDASKPYCYGDTCACDPTDKKCNPSGLTVVEIVGIAVGGAVFVIALILVIKYRKAIMTKLTRKKTQSQQPKQSKPKRIKVEHTPSSAFSSPDQKKEPVTIEDSAAAPSPLTKQVKLDFEEGKGGVASIHGSPAKPLIGSKNHLDTLGSPKTKADNIFGIQAVNEPTLEKKGSQLRTLG